MILLTKAALATLGWLSVASAQYYAVTGVRDGIGSNGLPPARLNIDDLLSDDYACPLFMQAMASMQSMSQKTQTSFFQMAGIHGRPYTPWNNINGQFGYTGYCTHESVLFPTWHRPYMAMFEQELNSHAQTIARQYFGANKIKYIAAAKTLRMPYWDWAASPAIPTILSTPNITIMTPTGKHQINNPLYTFKMPALDPKYFPPQGAYDSYLANDTTTIRDPNASANLMNAGLKSAAYNLFSRISNYETFATQAVSGSSLEAVHGTVHVYVGGNYGHMTQLSYAAFDPIFWFHHCNVDRLFALWEAIYPDAFIPAQGLKDDYGTFTIAPGTIENSSNPLTPFTSSTSGTLYTSDDARGLINWGYTYPELITNGNQSKSQIAATVMAKVNALYNPSGANSTSHHKRHARDVSNTKQHEWFVNIQVAKSDLPSSSVVFVFVGPPPADTTAWKGAQNLAGSLFVSLPPNPSMGADSTSFTHAEIALKDALAKAALSDYSLASVATFLKDNMQWRVQGVDGTVVDLSSLPSLRITVQEEEVTPPANEHSFPTYGSATPHPEITQGKAGGYSASAAS